LAGQANLKLFWQRQDDVGNRTRASLVAKQGTKSFAVDPGIRWQLGTDCNCLSIKPQGETCMSFVGRWVTQHSGETSAPIHQHVEELALLEWSPKVDPLAVNPVSVVHAGMLVGGLNLDCHIHRVQPLDDPLRPTERALLEFKSGTGECLGGSTLR